MPSGSFFSLQKKNTKNITKTKAMHSTSLGLCWILPCLFGCCCGRLHFLPSFLLPNPPHARTPKKCILLESGACKGSKLKHNMWYVLAQKQTRFNMACWCWMTCPAVASKIMQMHSYLINVWMFTQLKTLKVLTGSKACHLASDTKQLLQGGPSKTRNGHNSWQTLKAPSNISNVCRVA